MTENHVADIEDDDGSVCIDGYPEHLEDVTYSGPDGTQWMCRRCGAEGGSVFDDEEGGE